MKRLHRTRKRRARSRPGVPVAARLLLMGLSLALGGCASFPEFMQDLRRWVSAGPSPHEAPAEPRPIGTAAGHFAVGRLDFTEGRLDAAVLRFRQALRLDPWHLEARNALGAALSLQGHHDEAIAVLRQALGMFPDTAHLLGNLGHALQRAGQVEEARAVLERALALDPALQRSRRNLADLKPPVASDTGAASLAVSASVEPYAEPSVEPSVQAFVPPDAAALSQSRPSAPRPALGLTAIEVSNAAGENHLARRTARKLATWDAQVVRLTESRPFSARATELQYRLGHRDAALRLRQLLPIACELSQVETLRADVNLRLVAGRDLASAHPRW